MKKLQAPLNKDILHTFLFRILRQTTTVLLNIQSKVSSKSWILDLDSTCLH